MINKRIYSVLSVLFLLAISFNSFSIQEKLDSIPTETPQVEQLEKVTSFEITEDVFKNVTAKAIEDGAKITWSVDYKAVETLEKQG